MTPVEHVAQFFNYEHLPPELQVVSRQFYLLANFMVETLPHNQELTVSLRKLLEAKDAAVRAKLLENVVPLKTEEKDSA